LVGCFSGKRGEKLFMGKNKTQEYNLPRKSISAILGSVKNLSQFWIKRTGQDRMNIGAKNFAPFVYLGSHKIYRRGNTLLLWKMKGNK